MWAAGTIYRLIQREQISVDCRFEAVPTRVKNLLEHVSKFVRPIMDYGNRNNYCYIGNSDPCPYGKLLTAQAIPRPINDCCINGELNYKRKYQSKYIDGYASKNTDEWDFGEAGFKVLVYIGLCFYTLLDSSAFYA